MKKQYKLLMGLGVFLVLCSLTSTSTVYAAESWDTLEANVLYEKFANAAISQLNTAEHVVVASMSTYKKLTDKKPVSFEGYSNEGISRNPGANGMYYDSAAHAVYQSGIGKKGLVYEVDVVTKDKKVYLSFPNTKTKALKGKWVTVPEDKFKGTGEELGLSPLFEAAVIENSEEKRQILTKSIPLLKQHTVYADYTDEIEDEYSVEGATRYNLVFNADALAPYYKALSQKLTVEESQDTLLSIPGFVKYVSNPDISEYIADRSYVSLWIDNKTQLPARLLQVIFLPSGGRSTAVTLSISDIQWNNINAPVSIVVPTKNVLSYEEGRSAIGIPATTGPNDVITGFLTDLGRAKYNSEKAIIFYSLAQSYEEIGDTKIAAEYYKKSASMEKKNTVEYFNALAQAEWTAGKGKKAAEYYKKALKKAPKDTFIMDQYGWLLLGISSASPTYQDLRRALEVNTQYVKEETTDVSLMNLYINYVLLGQQANADALEEKFDAFGTPKNYNYIARAYHRMGNKAKAAEYMKLSKDAGYVSSLQDAKFYKQSF